jgi:hypothetical protein
MHSTMRTDPPATIETSPGPPVAGDAVDELLSLGEYPVLSAALRGKQGAALRAELLSALPPSFRHRAERHRVTRLGRLHTEHYDEVVMMTDISQTGVRLRVQKDCPLDLTHSGTMQLLVSTTGGHHALPVQLVRIAAENDKHLDIACRFLEPLPDSDLLANLRSLIFETHWTDERPPGR